MKKTAHIYLISLLILPLTFLLINSQGVSAESANFPTPDLNGNYHYRIEASQWEFVAFDINLMEGELGRSMNEEDFVGKSRFELEKFIVKHKIGEFDKKSLNFARLSSITLDVYSRDVQHGFSINEVNLAIATNRPTPGDLFGEVETRTFEAPDEDVTISAFCHIFCGLGHPDMKIKLVIGKGSFEFGPIVFWGAVGINVLILALVFRSIFTKVKT